MGEQIRRDAIAFLQKNTAGALATVGSDGSPHVRLVYYSCNDSFEIYFMTKRDSRKVEDIAGNPRAAFTISSQEVPQTLQIEGTASLVDIPAEPDAVLNALFERLASNKHFTAPITKMGDSELLLYKIAPLWIRWGDFAFAQKGPTGIFIEIAG